MEGAAVREGVWRWLVPLAVAAHAVGMIGGVYFVFTTASRVLGTLSDNISMRVVVAAMWVISGLALLWAAWLFYQGVDAWRTPGFLGASLSLLGIVLWAGNIPPGTYVGAALDVAIIAYAVMTRR